MPAYLYFIWVYIKYRGSMPGLIFFIEGHTSLSFLPALMYTGCITVLILLLYLITHSLKLVICKQTWSMELHLLALLHTTKRKSVHLIAHLCNILYSSVPYNKPSSYKNHHIKKENMASFVICKDNAFLEITSCSETLPSFFYLFIYLLNKKASSRYTIRRYTTFDFLSNPNMFTIIFNI